MKYITNYEIKFINNKPIIIINYSDNSFDMKELSNDLYYEVIESINNNIKLFNREYIVRDSKNNNLLKAGLICFGLSFSSPYLYILSNSNIPVLLSTNLVGFLYYFYNFYKSEDAYNNYLKYNLYLSNIDCFNKIDINDISINSLKVLSKRIKLIKKINTYNNDIYLPIIDICNINKLNLKDIEKIIDNSRKKKLVKNIIS